MCQHTLKLFQVDYLNFQIPELVVFIMDSDEHSGNLPEPEPSSRCLPELVWVLCLNHSSVLPILMQYAPYFSDCSLVLTTP